MSNGGSGVTRQIQTLFSLGTAGALSDVELLERFTSRRDAAAEAAFATLVERHGPIVFRVCRDLLGDRHDAEDAFQATFLVLVRRAASIRKRDALPSWLYGVALRVAGGARSSAARRRVHERKVSARTTEVVADEGVAIGKDLRPVLHEEVGRLPEKYRAAVVLCYWQGLTHEQAAERLSWPVGTVRSRLSWARRRLRSRLTRRGLAPTAALPFAAISHSAMSATLVESTIQGALRVAAGQAATGFVSASAWTLTEGAIRTMTLARWKMIAVVLLTVGVATAGAGVARQEPDAPATPATTPEEASKAGPPDYQANPEDLIANLKAYLRELQAKVKEKQKEWLEMASNLNGGRGEPIEGPSADPSVVEEYERVRELLFKASMDLIEVEALLHARKAGNLGSEAVTERDRLIQRQVEVTLNNDPEIVSLSGQVKEAERLAQQVAKLSRHPSDPASINSRRKLVTLQGKLKDLAERKRIDLAKHFGPDDSPSDRTPQLDILKERKGLYEKLLTVIEKLNRQRVTDSVKLSLVREELGGLKQMEESVQKRIEQLQFDSRKR